MKTQVYALIVMTSLLAGARADAGVQLQGPGLVLQGPGLVLQGPGLVLQGPGIVLQGPGVVLQGPGLVLQGPMLAGPAQGGAPAGAFAYPHSLIEACAAPIPRGEWPLAALDGRAIRVSLPN